MKFFEKFTNIILGYLFFHFLQNKIIITHLKIFMFSFPTTGLQQIKQMATIFGLHRQGYPHVKTRKNRNPFGPGKPFAKGVVLKTLIKKPKKPNSANRKCVLVRLSTGREMIAYVPGNFFFSTY